MNAFSRKRRSLPTRRLRPAPHDLDAAPQLLVVALADAALCALERALDCAHPLLAAAERFDRPPPDLNDSEHVALEVVDCAERLADVLRRYVDTVESSIDASLHELDDDLF